MLLVGFLTAGELRAESPATFQVSEFTFKRPASWEWVPPPTPMRRAELKVVGARTNEVAGVAFYYFGPQSGGTTEANVQRWLRQFVEPPTKIHAKVESISVAGIKVTYLQAEGTYLSGMPGGPITPLRGYALLGAILEGHEGNVFVRMTGPQALVHKQTPDFKRMVESGLGK